MLPYIVTRNSRFRLITAPRLRFIQRGYTLCIF